METIFGRLSAGVYVEGSKARQGTAPRDGRPAAMAAPAPRSAGPAMAKGRGLGRPARLAVAGAALTTEKRKSSYPGGKKGFLEEMRLASMRLHTKDQAKTGGQAADARPFGQWQLSAQGYLRFLVDSKLVFDAMESILSNAAHPAYSEFECTGLERSAKLMKDLEWFKTQGYEIPESGEPGLLYAQYLKNIAEDPPAFICHFYNIYFAHTSGGRMIGRKISEMILDGMELEFYKWDGDLAEMMATVKEKLNQVSEGWSRDEKDRCLEETKVSFEYSGKIQRLLIT